MSSFFYDAFDEAFKTPVGASIEHQETTFNILLAKSEQAHAVRLILRGNSGNSKGGNGESENAESENGENGESGTLVLEENNAISEKLARRVGVSPDLYTAYTLRYTPTARGLLYYRFEVDVPYGIRFVGCKAMRAKIEDFLPEWQLTVTSSASPLAEKWQHGIIYQIFPDRFLRSGEPLPDGFLNRKIHQEFLAVPDSTKNTKDYLATDFFGGNLKGIEEKLPYLASLGVSILYLNPIFESASNHRYNTANYLEVDPMLGNLDDFRSLCASASSHGISILLDGVFSHTGSDSLYFNKEGKYESLGAYQSENSPYYPWYRFHDFPNSYAAWWGFKTLPEVNEEDPSYQDFLFNQEYGVLPFWMRQGVAGWRLDVADELPSSFLQALRRCVKTENPDAFILGEVWEDASNKESYGDVRTFLQGEELDSVMNYPWRSAILDFMQTKDATAFFTSIAIIIDHYPKTALHGLMNSLSTHDTERVLSALADKKEDFASIPHENSLSFLSEEEKEASKKLCVLASFLQYALPGNPSLYYGDEILMYGGTDPYNRACFDWSQEGSGLYEHYKRLGQIRTENPKAFKDDMRFLYAKDGCFAFLRFDILCVVHFGTSPLAFPATNLLYAVGDFSFEEGSLTLKGDSACLAKVDPACYQDFALVTKES